MKPIVTRRFINIVASPSPNETIQRSMASSPDYRPTNARDERELNRTASPGRATLVPDLERFSRKAGTAKE
jgi:hypothetical protein